MDGLIQFETNYKSLESVYSCLEAYKSLIKIHPINLGWNIESYLDSRGIEIETYPNEKVFHTIKWLVEHSKEMGPKIKESER